MSPKPYTDGKANPLGELTELDAQTYGDVDLPESGRVIARPVYVYDVIPDVRQPRRAIPVQFRGSDPSCPNLVAWRLEVERRLDTQLPIKELITGGISDEFSSDDPVVAAYMDALKLASSIATEGLLNPIHVVRKGERLIIESGERRWLAYHLLFRNLSPAGDWEKIPAVEKARADVWAQAAENGSRAPLNAISMARQLALLVMDMYAHDRGVHFDDYDFCVRPGGCDRAFYAQVRNGTTYQIKRGLAERVLSVTGLKSVAQISQYRSLLNIPDDLWVKADEQDWSEGRIREAVQALVPPKPAHDGLTTVNPQAESKPAYPAFTSPATRPPEPVRPRPARPALPTRGEENEPSTNPVHGFKLGMMVERKDGSEGGQITGISGDTLTVRAAKGRMIYGTANDFAEAADVPVPPQRRDVVDAQTGAVYRALPEQAKTPIMDEFGDDVAPILRFVKALARREDDDPVQQRMIELMAISRSNLAENAGDSAADEHWRDYFSKSDEMFSVVMQRVLNVLTEYTGYLMTVRGGYSDTARDE